MLLASAVAITFGAATSLQTAIPSYTASLEQHLTDSNSIRSDLEHIGNPNESAAAKRLQNAVHSVQSGGSPDFTPMADQVPKLSACRSPTAITFGASLASGTASA